MQTKILATKSRAILLFLCFFPLYGENIWYRDAIVAVVNDEAITAYEVALFNAESEKKIQREYYAKGPKSGKNQQSIEKALHESRAWAVHELINQKLIFADFEKKGYHIPDQLIDKRINAIVTQRVGGDWGKFEALLTSDEMNLEDLKKMIRKNAVLDILINQVVDQNIVISPRDISNYYQQHIDKFSTPKKISLQYIAINQQEKESSQSFHNRVTSIYSLLEATSFQHVASKYSDLPLTAQNISWLDEKDVRIEFIEALEGKEKNQFSKPVYLQEKAYIVLIADVIASQITPLDEVYNRIKNRLFSQEKKQRYNAYVDTLKNQTYVRIFYEMPLISGRTY